MKGSCVMSYLSKKTVEDLNVAGKRVLVRCDFNVPLKNGVITDEPDGVFVTVGEQVRLLPHNLPDCRGLGVIGAGVPIATVCKNRLEPAHTAFITANKEQCQRTIDFAPEDPTLRAFLHGEEIPCDQKGWTAVCVAGIPVGFGKASGGKLKNRCPKGLRLL